jgi:hypothetical protein
MFGEEGAGFSTLAAVNRRLVFIVLAVVISLVCGVCELSKQPHRLIQRGLCRGVGGLCGIGARAHITSANWTASRPKARAKYIIGMPVMRAHRMRRFPRLIAERHPPLSAAIEAGQEPGWAVDGALRPITARTDHPGLKNFDI